MYKPNLLSFMLKSITIFSLLFVLSSQIQAEERAPREKPSTTEVEKEHINISVPENSSAKDIEASVQKALEKRGHKPSAQDRRTIKNASESARNRRVTITISTKCCTIIITFGRR